MKNLDYKTIYNENINLTGFNFTGNRVNTVQIEILDKNEKDNKK